MKYKIKDLCKLISSGGTPSRKVKEYYHQGTINWIKTQELNDGNIYESEEKITELGLKNSSAKLFPINTVTMAMYGATVGKLGILMTESATNQACCNMVADPDKLDYKFLFYSLLYNRDEIISLANGAAQQNLNKKTIEEYEIDYFPLQEQKKIVSILSSLDEKIELNNRINKSLEEMAQAIFKSWFVDFEPFRDGEFVESELGMIPKGWILGSVYDFISEVNEKNRKREDYPVLTVTKEGKFLPSEEYFTKRVYSKDTSKYKVIRKYEVGFNPSRANIGSIAMLREFETGLLSPIYKVFRIHSRIKPVFFRYYMKQKGFIQRIAHHSSGTTRQNFDLDGFKYFPICVPPLEIQEQFGRLISPIQQMINANENENCKLSSIRDTLLPKLMSGEIRVPLD